MKKILSLIALCAASFSFANAQVGTAPFDTDVKDAEKKLKLVNNGVTFENDAQRNNSVAVFDGVSSYITTPTTFFNYDAITINLWFNWTTAVANQWWVRIWDFGTDTATVNHDVNFVTLFQDNLLKWHIHPKTWDNGSDTVLASKAPIELGKWYMLTCTHAKDSARLYLNGELQDARATGVSPKEMNGYMTTYIGKSNWPDPLFTGKMDQLSLYDKVLTSAEVTTLYNNQMTAVKGLRSAAVAQIYAAGYNLHVSLSNVKKDASISVFNIMGVEVYKLKNIGSFTTINTLNYGAYVVKVVNGGNVSTQKVIIQR